MAKLNGEYKTPFGQKGNIFSVGDWVSLILGGVVLIFTFAMSQNVAKFIGGSVPYADTTIERPWSNPDKQVSNNNGNRMEVI